MTDPRPRRGDAPGEPGNGFDARLRDVFAVLPAEEAAAAVSELVDHYAGDHRSAAALPWLDIGVDGAIVRGGITTPGDRLTRFIAHPAEQPELAEMVRVAETGSIFAGQIVPARDGCRFFWFAPAPRPSDHGGVALRGLAVGPEIFGTLVEHFAPGGQITSAEKRTLFQLVAGLAPREAAAADGVSFETKRAQLKSLCMKLHCGGQTDLVRRMVGQLTHLLHLSESGAADARVAEDFARRHFPPTVRLTIQLLDNGRVLRAFECGPQTGRPVLVAHGMLFPIVLLNASAACERLGLRLIMPIRSGYLDDPSGSALFKESDRAQDQADIAQFATRFGRRIPVIGHSIGASWAMSFARRYPEQVERLILLSPNFLGGGRSTSVFALFLEGLKALAARPGLLRYIAWQFRKLFLDERILRQVWRRICGESSDDLAVLDGRRGAGPIYGWFEAGYRSSPGGVADDMNAASDNWRDDLASLSGPVIIVFGAHDPIAGYAREPDVVTALPGITMVCLAAGGHLVAASHASETWKAVADVLTSV